MGISIADLRNKTGKYSAKIEQHKEKSEHDSRLKDHRFWAPTFDQEKGGSAVIRFLPQANLDDLPFVEVIKHWFKGETGEVYNEKSLRTIGASDPVAQLNSRLYNSGLESDKNQSRDQKQRKKYYSNILVVKDPANPENNGKVFLYEYGPMIFKKLEGAMFPQDGADPIEVFSPFEGANFNIKIAPQPMFNKIVPNYSNSYVSEQTGEIPGDIEEIMNQVYDLSEFKDPANFKSYDELAERLVEVLGYTTGSGIETVAGYGKKVPSIIKQNQKPYVEDADDIPTPKTKQIIEEDDDDEIEKMKRMLAAMDD